MADGIRDGKGKILRNTDPLFTELAENYPHDYYTSFCNEFGVGYTKAEQIRTEKLGNIAKALKEVLSKWVVANIEVTRSKLEKALQNTHTRGLKSIVKKNFDKYAEVEESCEEAGPSQSEATQANTQDGSRTGQSTAMTGNTSHVANDAQTAGSRKRKADGSDGPNGKNPGKKAANENTIMPMTTRHRNILERSAPKLQLDLDTNDVLTPLLGNGVINRADFDQVNSNATRREKITTLLDILPRRGDKAYDAFLNSLKDTKGSEHLYNVMKDYEKNYVERDVPEENEPISHVSHGQGTSTASSSSTGNTDRQGQIVTAQQIKKLAKLLRPNVCSDLCVELGLEYNFFEQMKSKHREDYEAAYKEILHTWKEKTDGLAEDLDDALNSCHVGRLKNEYKK